MDRGIVITDVEGDAIDISLTEDGVEVIRLKKKGGKNDNK